MPGLPTLPDQLDLPLAQARSMFVYHIRVGLGMPLDAPEDRDGGKEDRAVSRILACQEIP